MKQFLITVQLVETMHLAARQLICYGDLLQKYHYLIQSRRLVHHVGH